MPRTILLADDSVTIRKVVELTFSDTDIRVDAVGSGQEALQRLREISPDLVLADVVMPGPTGYEICRAVKASSRPVPVLLLTGTFEPFDAALAKACGSDGHVTKPFDSRSLVERVEALLAHGGAGAVAADETDFEAMFDGLAAPKAPERPPAVDRREPAARAISVPAPPEPARPSKEGAPTRVASPPPPAAPAAPVSHAAPAQSAAPSPAATQDVAPDRAVAQASAAVTPTAAPALSPADVDAIARAVVEKLSDAVLREIAWDVVPDVAEIVVRERLRELERDDRDPS